MHTKQICITLRVEEPVGLDDVGIKTELFEEQPQFCEPLFKALIQFIHFTLQVNLLTPIKGVCRSHTAVTQQIHDNKKKTDKTEEGLSEWRALTASSQHQGG